MEFSYYQVSTKQIIKINSVYQILIEANIWKERRKLINPTFNPQVLNSFIGNFGKHSNIIVRALEELCGQEIDVFMTLFKYTLNLACGEFQKKKNLK